MDPRDKKPRDFVAISKNLTEGVKKTGRIQMKWLQKYEWLIDEHEKLRQEIEELCKEKLSTDIAENVVENDTRSCLPAPITTSSEYGWLANKPQFQLERYGSYILHLDYPNPLRDITLLRGNVPMLAAGKGFIW